MGTLASRLDCMRNQVLNPLIPMGFNSNILTEDDKIQLATHNVNGEPVFNTELVERSAKILLQVCMENKEEWKEKYGDPDKLVSFLTEQKLIK